MKKLLLVGLMGLSGSLMQAGPLKTIQVENKSPYVLFGAWSETIVGQKLKTGSFRLLPKSSKSFTNLKGVGLFDLQFDVGKKIGKEKAAIEAYKKSYATQAITSSRVDITVDANGKATITQGEAEASGLLKNSDIKNDSDWVLMVAWILDTGLTKSKGDYARLKPHESKNFSLRGLRGTLQVEPVVNIGGSGGIEDYTNSVNKGKTAITTKRVDVTVDESKNPPVAVIKQ